MRGNKSRIDWSAFDAVWCVHHAPYAKRMEYMEREIGRIGIPRERFFWQFTVKSPFDGILYDVSKKLNSNTCANASVMNCALGHYRCIKSSLDMGLKRILVMEDDMRFLEDLGRLGSVVSAMPYDSDVVLFNQTITDENLAKWREKGRIGDGDGYTKYDFPVFSAGCYSLSRKAMERMVSAYEKALQPADWYTGLKVDLGEGLNYYYSNTQLCLQSEIGDMMSGPHNHVYERIGVTFDGYRTYEGDNSVCVKFHIVVPMRNVEGFVKRCIDSIKSQNFTNYEVTLVDDCSTDGTNEVVEREIKGDSRFHHIRLRKRVCGGGARNAALESGVSSDYTMFLDADDTFHSVSSLKNVYLVIRANKNPDIVVSSFYSHSLKKTVPMSFDSVEKFAKSQVAFAPWTKCVKTELAAKFVAERICCNDVVHHLRQCDCVKTIACVQTPVVSYHNDCKESCWNNDGRMRQRCVSLVQLVSDLKKEKFANKYSSEARDILVKRYEGELERNFPGSGLIRDAVRFSTDVQKLNIDNPVTFQDKLGYIKTYGVTGLKKTCCDKLLLHKHCKDRLGKDICVPVYGVYRSVREINLSALPNSFVLKCNHGCGYNIVVRDKSKTDFRDAFGKLTKWMGEDYALKGFELQYHGVERRIFAEEFIGDPNSKDDISDYKFFCFNGVPKVFQVASKDGGGLCLNFYDADFNFIPLCNTAHPNNPQRKDAKPKNFEQMKEYAKVLSRDFDFVRVDFYEQNGRVYLGELTFTPGNAGFHYKDQSDEVRLGEWLTLDIDSKY